MGDAEYVKVFKRNLQNPNKNELLVSLPNWAGWIIWNFQGNPRNKTVK